ncbi:hypothetical protein BD408DRAFT_417459 [Parasitella parasitica]|nr:hypothetical protein BD408DRAFT_417459 [Parasitella parasitica]
MVPFTQPSLILIFRKSIIGIPTFKHRSSRSRVSFNAFFAVPAVPTKASMALNFTSSLGEPL